MTATTDTVIISVNSNAGYASDQAENGVTLADLAEMISCAISEFGPNAQVVTEDSGNRYGANWGNINTLEEIKSVCQDDEEDDWS